jgi:hypothetical protein
MSVGSLLRKRASSLKSTTILSSIATDAAAEFAAALSLWRACESLEETSLINLSECYDGVDQLMREVMRIAHLFERWASAHVEFAELSKVWPYLLEDQFGTACLQLLPVEALHQFSEADCLRTALQLKLPLK